MTALKPTTVIVLLLLLAFPQITATYFRALKSPLKDFSLLTSPFNALENGFGASEVLPLEATDAIKLAQKHHIGAFFLSDGITRDELIFQRMIEALYPLTPTIESPFVFFKAHENILTGCDLLDETSVVKLARCI